MSKVPSSGVFCNLSWRWMFSSIVMLSGPVIETPYVPNMQYVNLRCKHGNAIREVVEAPPKPMAVSREALVGTG